MRRPISFSLLLRLSRIPFFFNLAAFAQNQSNSQPVAYAYVGSGVPGQSDATAGTINAFAIAADGSAQAISRTFGAIGGLTAASGFVFGIGGSGTSVRPILRSPTAHCVRPHR